MAGRLAQAHTRPASNPPRRSHTPLPFPLSLLHVSPSFPLPVLTLPAYKVLGSIMAFSNTICFSLSFPDPLLPHPDPQYFPAVVTSFPPPCPACSVPLFPQQLFSPLVVPFLVM